MITAQDIREKTFEKAVFGGYDMATVDTFLEEVANDLVLLQKENSTLRGKMKVLVDKVEEYRRNEDALQMAILSAQKMGNQIEKSAKEQADAILDEARQEAARIVEEATYESRAEKTRLEEAKSVSAKFIDSMDMLCRRQLEFLQKMNELDFIKQLRASNPPQTPTQSASAAPAAAETPAPEAAPRRTDQGQELHQTVRDIGENVARAMDEPVVSVRPEVRPAVVDDERPTRNFNIITDPAESIDVSRGIE
ncbi:MAG: DivIVA domain-containing protein [Oscillospiraceae bacterium]|nr:DivIVA domain-containing protein [Oscillospiraceae bacterium]